MAALQEFRVSDAWYATLKGARCSGGRAKALGAPQIAWPSTRAMWHEIVSGIVLLLVAHAVHDLVQFVTLKRDVKWMKAEMRKHGMVAPNGDDD